MAARWTRLRSGLLALLVACLVCIACGGRSGGGDGRAGGLFVLVFDERGELESDARIETEPVTEQKFTDLFGSALIQDVAPGFYRVTARIASRVGSEAVQVTSGEVARVAVHLGQNNDVGIGGSSAKPAGNGGSSTGKAGAPSSGGKATSMGGSGPVDADYSDVGTQVEAMMVDPSRP